MAQLNIATEPAPGVTIDQKDDKITITITTTPPSDAKTIGWNTRALWHEAYARLHEEHTKELVDFEEQARIVLQPLLRRNSSNTLARSSMPGWHNIAPNTVLSAIDRWIFEGGSDGTKETDRDDEEEHNEARRALSSIKTLLDGNVQESPGAHLAWVAAILCIQTLIEKPRPTSEAPGLAYIVARITFYDRLSRLASKKPGHGEAGDKPLTEGLVDLYAAVLKQLIVVLALGHVPRETRAQQQMFDRPKVGVGSEAIHPIIALESSIGEHVRDKALEEAIAELVRLQTPPLAVSDMDDKDACETVNDKTKGNDDVDDEDDNDSDDEADDDDYSDVDPSDNSENDESNANAKPYATTYINGDDASVYSEIQKMLCTAPIQPPSLPPPPLSLDGSPGVLDDLYHWASKQDAYRRWCKAPSADDVDSEDRILWVYSQDSSVTTMLLHALAQAETKNRPAEMYAGRPQHAVAHAFWNWYRDVNGTSVVSVLRDLVWTMMAVQPKLQTHLEEAVRVMGRRPLLGGEGDDSTARYAALGTSCDFYAMLALLCRLVRDPECAPTCFVVDYTDVPWDDDDGDIDDEGDRDESHKNGRSGSARTAEERAWTLRDLVALVHTTCRQPCKVAWILSSSSLSSSLLKGGNCLHLSPADPTLDSILHRHVRARLQDRLAKSYTPDILEQLTSELMRQAGHNFNWSTLAIDLLARVRLPWNAISVLKRLSDGSADLCSLLDWTVRNNVRDGDSDDASARELFDTFLYVAALAFQPLTVQELVALAELPVTVDAVVFIDVLTRPLLEFPPKDNMNGSRDVHTCVYFSSQAVLAAQRARLVKSTAARDLHANMVCRHLRCLTRHYGDSGGRQLSMYMRFAWLRHLDRVGIGPTENPPDPLEDEVCGFVARMAAAWLCDLETLGVIDVAKRMLQDLLPSTRGKEQLSPIQAVLETLLMRIVRAQALDMSLTDTERFLRITGCEAGENEENDLPVLPSLLSLGPPPVVSRKMAEAGALIATLEGHTDWVRDTTWAYDGRLVLSISDDNTLRCWDRASCSMQHVMGDIQMGYATQLDLSQTDPSMLVAMDSQDIIHFDLSIGAIPIKKISHFEIVTEWRKQQDEDSADRELGSFSCLDFAEDGSNDIIITCIVDEAQAHEVILSTPGFTLKEVRRIALGYNSLPPNLADALPKSECRDAVVADNVGLAAVVRNDGDVLIYNTKLAEQQQTLHWAQNKFTYVKYDMLWRVFCIWDERADGMFYFVHKSGEQVEQEEREPTKPTYKPLIRSYRPPHPDALSYSFPHDRQEVVFTYRYKPTKIYKVIEADIDDGDNATRTRDETAQATLSFTCTLFSHDGLRVATANTGGQVQLWDLPHMATAESNVSDAAGATLWRTMENSKFEVNWLSFSKDDSRLLACYDNGQTDVWDTDTGERVAVLRENTSGIRIATFSHGDALVATVPFNGLARLWDLEACQEVYQDTHGTMSGYFAEEDSASGDSSSDDSSSDDNNHSNRNDDKEKTTPPTKRISVTLEGAAGSTSGTVAFSPDGRFLAMADRPGHIWDISSDTSSNTALPPGPLMPCTTLYWKASSTQKPEKGRTPKEQPADTNNSNINVDDNDHNIGDNDEHVDDNDDDDDDGDDDDDDDDDNDDNGASCSSFVFSPDSRSLLGFRSDGWLFKWTRTSITPSSSSPLSSSSDYWEWRVAVLAHGFAVPDGNSLWKYQPRRLSVSEGTDGQYLLHTEIGVWVLPSTHTDEKIGLQPSMHHRCNVVKIDNNMAILWQNQPLFRLPQLYAPFQPYFFMMYTCDIHTVDGSTSTIVIGTETGHLLCFRFRGKETDVKTSGEISR